MNNLFIPYQKETTNFWNKGGNFALLKRRKRTNFVIFDFGKLEIEIKLEDKIWI